MTKKQKLAAWMNKHQDGLIFTVVTVAVVGAFTALVIVSAKEQNKMVADWNAYVEGFNDWLNEEARNGNVVYQLIDGRYLTVAADTIRETVIK